MRAAKVEELTLYRYFSVVSRVLALGNWRTPGSTATKQPRRSCPSCWSRRASSWTKKALSASSKADHLKGRGATAWRQLPQRVEVQPPLGTSQDSAQTHLRPAASRNKDPQAEAGWADSRERKLEEQIEWRHRRKHSSERFAFCAPKSGSSKLTLMLVAWPKIKINSIEPLRLLRMLLCWTTSS